jgi:hypothetical protein
VQENTQFLGREDQIRSDQISLPSGHKPRKTSQAKTKKDIAMCELQTISQTGRSN